MDAERVGSPDPCAPYESGAADLPVDQRNIPRILEGRVPSLSRLAAAPSYNFDCG